MLQSQAGVRLGTGGTTDFSCPVLYGDASPAIREEAEAAATEMLLAAWFYLSERAGLKEVEMDRLGDAPYREQLKRYLDIGERIIALLTEAKSAQDQELAAEILDKVGKVRRATRKGAGQSNVGS